MKKRTTIIMLLTLVAGLGLWAALASGVGAKAVAAETSHASAVQLASADAPVVTVYKNPSCACCAEWVEHLEENGFETEEKEARLNIMEIKAEHGISPNLASCHTALVGDYVLEGHVPADLVSQLLKEAPAIRGLAVPGMPAGVPGMPEAGANRAPYQILAIQQDGSTQLYATR